jgi:16S rRNA (adenine1518-N6/adenine1519-N6)-dimethyltransferase
MAANYGERDGSSITKHEFPDNHYSDDMIELHARKSLGQHFLVDPKAHERIVKAIAPQQEDVIIEIGPGTGLLTRRLLTTPLKKLVAFELDTRAIPELRREFEAEGSRVEIIEQDFLTVDLKARMEQEGAKLRVAGNIPYYITSPILFKLIDEREAIRDATLLLQQEVAERLIAHPSTKAYGIPTVLANFFGEVKLLFKIPAGAFRPVPNVDSAVIHIDFERGYFARTHHQMPENFDEHSFRKLVRGVFAMRRKTIRNNLKALITSEALAAIEKSDANRFLTLRGEALSIENFLELSASLSERIT